MNDLISALQILSKYSEEKRPTYCEHDTFYVMVDPLDVSDEDIKSLDSLGFSADTDNGRFFSFIFGSC